MLNYTEIFSNEIGDKMSGYVMGIDVNSARPTTPCTQFRG
jgi:hypothetical protein